ncbi:MAG: peptide chain release factor N(5)-glutamine methyltransferase [Pseudomonadota bacterium]
MLLTIQDMLQAGAERLADSESSARLEAEILLGLALGQPREFLYAWPEEQVNDAAQANFDALLDRRIVGEPIAYITGWREFWSLELQVTPDTLIPRPETERLVELALERIPEDADWRVADLGTGSGAIALALATERRGIQVVAVENSEAAADVARMNAARLDVANVEVHVADMDEMLESDTFDLIVSNPPYVAEADPHLIEGDVRFEPGSALVAGAEGLDRLASIVRATPAGLRDGGHLLLEHGADQGPAVRNLMRVEGLHGVATYRDYGGRERVSCATAR